MSTSGDTVRTAPPTLANPVETIEQIEHSIHTLVTETGAKGAVVNLSGGIDSTVTATLAVRALGSERVTGLILPAETNSQANIDDARLVAEELVIDSDIIEIQPLLDAFLKTVSSESYVTKSDPLSRSNGIMTVPTKRRKDVEMALGNAAARLRMMIAYFEANTMDLIVLGTGNYTELQLGYFTKYGDGACDYLPIGDLYKSEVRQIASILDVHQRIIDKPPTAGLLTGQADELELGASYEQIDTILWNLLETDIGVALMADQTGIDRETIERFACMIDTAAHKRTGPATAGALLGTDFERVGSD